MAKPSLNNSVKYKALVAVLAIPRPHVRGHLESIWDVANETGNHSFSSVFEVEAAAEWTGERGKFCAAMVECRLLDATDGGAYSIHDYWHHAPEYVLKRRLREQERVERANGASRRTTADNGGQRRILADNGAPPTPTPTPTPILKDKEKKKSLARFTKPTVEEVRAFCAQRGNSIDPEMFVDHYEANGWKVGGKSPMRNWQASVRNWEKRAVDHPPRDPPAAGPPRPISDEDMAHGTYTGNAFQKNTKTCRNATCQRTACIEAREMSHAE